MKVLHIAAECFPFAKVGGLADIVGALPKYLNQSGAHGSVIIPQYAVESCTENHFSCVFSSTVKLGNFNFPFRIQKENNTSLGFELFLVDIPELLDREEIYGFEDDIERLVSFQIAVLDWVNSLENAPNIIHCHDHQTALIPFMLRYATKYEKIKTISTVMTVHSTLYQGQFGFDKLYYLPEFNLSNIVLLEWNNALNSLAAGIKCASVLSTVSSSFLNEMNNFSHGLESLFTTYRYKSIGILNGIDTALWDPKNDVLLAKKYAIKTVENGKQKNKLELCRRFNLDPSQPLFSFIGRLFPEKGADLLPQVATQVLSKNYKALTILILGVGTIELENHLIELAKNFKGNLSIYIGYDEKLAHLIYAASDFLLMPSRTESCGLNQMYAFKYGTIPIVRRTGGLKDTVIDIGDGSNGICHEQATVVDICDSIQRALALYNDKKSVKNLRQKIMTIDHSWELTGQKYIKMYQSIPH
jgi:starch synthase